MFRPVLGEKPPLLKPLGEKPPKLKPLGEKPPPSKKKLTIEKKPNLS